MRSVLRGSSATWEVCPGVRSRAGSRVFRTHTEALYFLRDVARDSYTLARTVTELRRLGAHLGLRLHRADPEEFLQIVARWLVDGTLAIYPLTSRMADREMVAEVPETETYVPLPPSPAERKTWIEVQLLDEDGEPVASERYWIRLPDGSVRQGRLDNHGLVRIEPLDEGECVVRWPTLDDTAATLEVSLTPATARTYVPTVPRPPVDTIRTWIELELWDDDGSPVASAAYHLEASDGSVHEGTLDGIGRARIDGIPPGMCHVRFSGIDDDAWIEPPKP